MPTRPTPLRCLALLVPIVASATLGCAAVARGRAAESAEDAEGESAKDRRAELERKLELARLELDLARLEQEQELDLAERELSAARLELEVARLSQQAFLTLGREHELEEARLDLDRSRGRAEDAEAELAELESMYAAEEFASKTKELVLTRSHRDLELARRALALAERKRQQLESYELPEKEHELAKDLQAAETGVVEAEQSLEHRRLEHRVSVLEAETEVAELERKLRALDEEGDEEGEKKGDEEHAEGASEGGATDGACKERLPAEEGAEIASILWLAPLAGSR